MPHRKVACSGGSDLGRTNDPGNQVSPEPLCIYTQMHLAALTQGSGNARRQGRVVPAPAGYYGLQGHAGCQGEISCDPLLWGYLGCRFCVAAHIPVPWAITDA